MADRIDRILGVIDEALEDNAPRPLKSGWKFCWRCTKREHHGDPLELCKTCRAYLMEGEPDG